MLLEEPLPASLNSSFFVKAALTTNPFHFQYVVLLGKAISVLLALSGDGTVRDLSLNFLNIRLEDRHIFGLLLSRT